MNTDELEKKLREAANEISAFVKDGTAEAKIYGAYKLAKDAYAAIGVDTDAAIAKIDTVDLSLHCWQGDDVSGFEHEDTALTGGIMTTGNYPGKARNSEQLFADLEKTLSMIPGPKKVNVHANYITSKEKPDRDAIEPENYSGWADWAVANKIGLDFNSTFFSHPKADSGYTLASADDGIRNFWIEHAIRSRRVGEYFGRRTGKLCVVNHWIADGSKESPIDKMGPRERLIDSFDRIFREHLNTAYTKDSVESKLFGIGSEAYVPGSHEFYMGYALTRKNTMVTLDTGHFHPTESVAQKLSSLLCFMPEVLLHVSRPIRWDSDHVVIMDDELRALMSEIVRCNALNRTYIATDYFDASINRLAAWIVGARNTKKMLLNALLEPVADLKAAELAGDNTARLALTEEYKSYPLGAVWDYYCLTKNVPVRGAWLDEVKKYEADVLSKR